jgi:hypothetical protein
MSKAVLTFENETAFKNASDIAGVRIDKIISLGGINRAEVYYRNGAQLRDLGKFESLATSEMVVTDLEAARLKAKSEKSAESKPKTNKK